jgi:hypothetical protein
MASQHLRTKIKSPSKIQSPRAAPDLFGLTRMKAAFVWMIVGCTGIHDPAARFPFPNSASTSISVPSSCHNVALPSGPAQTVKGDEERQRSKKSVPRVKSSIVCTVSSHRYLPSWSITWNASMRESSPVSMF